MSAVLCVPLHRLSCSEANHSLADSSDDPCLCPLGRRKPSGEVQKPVAEKPAELWPERAGEAAALTFLPATFLATSGADVVRA
ncbi:hypothetical protein H920_02496 [Fukomys damarensis]|uniref:Uncharacterized protein n=1 Tax=Fukomys damarensis TaxID=885580 RepID=A0A091DYG7_FUKDA|nr:hypothetical protein H920_02496 [Fukomys damarensis]